MRSCLEGEAVFIHTDLEWRADAVLAWEEMGGDRNVIEELFRQADAK